MFLRRALSLVAAGALSVGALVLAAAPAQAATYTIDVVVAANCSATSSFGLPGVLAPTDIIVMNTSGPGVGGSGPCGITVKPVSGSLTSSGWIDRTGGGSTALTGTGFTASLMTAGSISFEAGTVNATIFSRLSSDLAATPITTIATWSLAGGGFTSSSPSSSSSSSSGPAPVVQQFGTPASGTCNDAAPATLNWGGASSGGWSESWAQWINGGTGGSVCSRTLQYSGSRGAWVVG